jgi:hypothetical protein
MAIIFFAIRFKTPVRNVTSTAPGMIQIILEPDARPRSRWWVGHPAASYPD